MSKYTKDQVHRMAKIALAHRDGDFGIGSFRYLRFKMTLAKRTGVPHNLIDKKIEALAHGA